MENKINKDIEDNRHRAIELINAYYDGKDIVMKDDVRGVDNWVSIKHPEYWSFLDQFCKNLSKYKIL